MEKIKEFVTRNKWTFAKTYAKFCPHEYIVKAELSDADKEMFVYTVRWIRENGFPLSYGKSPDKPYWYYNGYYYWTMGDPAEKETILNRAKRENYDIRIRFNGGDRC